MTEADEPIVWRTIDEAAVLCHRSRGTIKNLIWKHQLPRRLLWRVRGRRRVLVVLLSPAVVRALQRLTLEAPVSAKKTPEGSSDAVTP